MTSRTHLQRLEAESIQIMREVVAECEKPVMLYSVGKDSSVMLHLARKAFYPSPPPFPLLHVDTTWKFREMYAFRDTVAAENGHGAAGLSEPGGVAARHQPVRPRLGDAHRHVEDRGAEAGAGQVRLRRRVRRRPPRRGEVPGQGADLLLPLGAAPLGSRRTSGPSCGGSTTRARARARAIRVFPLSNWTELDIWQYIHNRENPDRAAVLRRSRGRWSSATAR